MIDVLFGIILALHKPVVFDPDGGLAVAMPGRRFEVPVLQTLPYHERVLRVGEARLCDA